MSSDQSNGGKSCWKNFTKIICCDSDPKYPRPYKFQFHGHDKTPQNEELFQSNFVRTSKYTTLSFFPKALILQFKRLANVYFLIIAILQTIPQISPLNPITAWIPLIVVLAISMLREGFEDYQRMKSDNKANATKAMVMRNGQFQEVQWRYVVTGDIVKVCRDQLFPADLVLLTSSSEGAAFIQTASLDGERNLKLKNSFKDLIPYDTPEKIAKLKGTFQTSDPDEDLHNFSGSLTIQGFKQSLEIGGLKQFLFRGTVLKNTNWIYGLAVMTGRNTKIIMNSAPAAQKMSQIQQKVNYILVAILVVQVCISFFVAVAFGIFRNQNLDRYNYIAWAREYNSPVDSLLVFFSQFVLINTMIPISLIVSIEVVKFAQMIFIQKDKLMYSKLRDKMVQVKSQALNEQLGQVEYVFTDKTGTLTLNDMQFKIAVIGTQMFGDTSLIMNNQGQKRVMSEEQKNTGFQDDKLKTLLETGAGQRRLDQAIEIRDSSGGNSLNISSLRQLAQEYIKSLALAHEVMSDFDEKKKKKIFQGPSPDQITLVEGAKTMGYQFLKATQSQTFLSIFGKQTSFQLLQSFAFTSDRKRMSIVIRDKGVLKMYMKGADSIVLKRTSKNSKLDLNNELQRFSLIGLRTLLIAMKTISDSEYQTFRNQRQGLRSKGLNQQQRQEKQNQLIGKLEENVYIIGATAVLDRLQDEVPETIRDLIRANIKVWMLTGDKMETAENIAKSCNLIQPDFQVIKYTPPQNLSDQKMVELLKDAVTRSDQLKKDLIPKALLIQGTDLTPIFKCQQARTQLANLAQNCQGVVCCRLTPVQKAQVVELVRQKLNKITLAIGDGANDVNMITKAHIGVGLYGNQGMGAVQSADYALGEFRMLWRLLLVHGRWNYIRISEMILYFFYKNMLFTLPQFYIAFYCGFSAQTLFDDWYVALYNLAFTSIPLVIRAVFQQDVNYIFKKNDRIQEKPNAPTLKTLIKQQQNLPQNYKTNKYIYRLFPKIYFIGQQNCVFNMRNYAAWMVQALVQSLVIFFFTWYIMTNLSVNSNGINSDYWLGGLTIYSCIILVVTFKLCTHTKFWSWILVGGIAITSLGFYICHMWLTNYFLTYNIQGTTYVAWTSLQPYFVVLFCVCLVLFVDGIVVFMDFNRGGQTSRMRTIINQQRMNDSEYYSQYNLTITDNITTATQKVFRDDYFKNPMQASGMNLKK